MGAYMASPPEEIVEKRQYLATLFFYFIFFFIIINAVRLQTTIQYITTLMTTQINNLYNTTIIIHKGPKV